MQYKHASLHVFAFVITLATAVPRVGSAQIDPSAMVDLNRSIQETVRRTVPIVTVRISQKSAAYKAVYQYGVAPVIVGLTPEGSAIGYRLELLVTVPVTIDDTDEARVRG